MRFFGLAADARRAFRRRDELESTRRAASASGCAQRGCESPSSCLRRSLRRIRVRTRQRKSMPQCIFYEAHLAILPTSTHAHLAGTPRRATVPRALTCMPDARFRSTHLTEKGTPTILRAHVSAYARRGVAMPLGGAQLRSRHDTPHRAPVPAPAALSTRLPRTAGAEPALFSSAFAGALAWLLSGRRVSPLPPSYRDVTNPEAPTPPPATGKLAPLVHQPVPQDI
jgi:hypothetical protein